MQPARVSKPGRGSSPFRLRWCALGPLLLAAAVAALTLGACGDEETCPEGYVCTAESGGGGAGGMGATSASMSATSASTGVSPACDPHQSGMPVEPTCGIFVDPSQPSGDGSQAMPFATLTDALANNPMNQPI